jgi:hypothetical protein
VVDRSALDSSGKQSYLSAVAEADDNALVRLSLRCLSNFFILWLCPSRKGVQLCRTPFYWQKERFWMTYLMFCSFLAPTTPAPTFPPELMGLPIAGGNHEDISAMEHASEPGSTALAGSGAPGNFVVGHPGHDMGVDTNLGSDALDGDSDFGQRLMCGRCKSVK